MTELSGSVGNAGFAGGLIFRAATSDCFGTKKNERNAMITLLVIAVICIVISVLTKSGGMGSIGGLSFLAGGFLLGRRIIRDRLNNHTPLSKMPTFQEIKTGVFKPEGNEEIEIKAPECLITGLQNAKIKSVSTNLFAEVDPNRSDFEKIVSGIVFNKKPPAVCHGKLGNGQSFVLVKLMQTDAKDLTLHRDNFLFFTGPEIQIATDAKSWRAFDTTITSNDFDIFFSFNNKDDIQKLGDVLKNGEGVLRRGVGKPDWKVTIPAT